MQAFSHGLRRVGLEGSSVESKGGWQVFSLGQCRSG